MYVIGIDLSGPANAADTAVVAYKVQRDRLVLTETHPGADDHAILAGFLEWCAKTKLLLELMHPCHIMSAVVTALETHASELLLSMRVYDQGQ